MNRSKSILCSDSAFQASKQTEEEIYFDWPERSTEEIQIKSQIVNADSSIATTLLRLENVRVQVELIQEDTNNLKEHFTDMAKRIDVLATRCHDERDFILKRRTKA